jgi:dienelactone hydrolase
MSMKRLRRFLMVFVWMASFVTVTRAAEAFVPAWRTTTVTNEVAVTRAEWFDVKRDRKVPVKIYSPKSGHGPFPIIIFSHGLGGSREGYAYVGQYWATHGYVSVHLQHVGSDDGVWKDVGLGERMTAMRRAAAQPQNAMNRVQDVSFALDQLIRFNATNSSWQGKLDLNRVGVAGHSFGAQTTLATAGASYSLGLNRGVVADPRVKAAMPMSAPVPAAKARLDAVFAGIKIPCLHMTGTEDDSPIGETKAAERRLPFDHCHNSDQFLITFTGGDHAIFGGRERRLGGAKDAEFQRLICLSSLAFWDAYLQDDAKAKEWLSAKFKNALGEEGVFEMKPKR